MRIRNQYKNPSGVKDFFYSDGLLRDNIQNLIRDSYKKYGFLPIETSILNNTEMLASKYGGGAEILKEMYQLSDQGERDLALRYDLTVPFIKYMGMNPSLKFPVKRFEIGKVFRNGPVKKGRLREFTQCDADILGVSDVMAEAELLSVVTGVLEKLDIEYRVEINNVKVIYGLLKYMEIEESLYKGIYLTLDKRLKITETELREELILKGLSEDDVDFLIEKLNDVDKYGSSSLDVLGESMIVEGLNELERLSYYLYGKNVKWNPYLARGLEIYTGSVYEVFIENGSVTSSVSSGGRYDKVIGDMLNGKMDVPAVGISIGLDVILTELIEKNIESKKNVDYLIIPLGTERESMKVADLLREKGYVVEVEMVKKKLSKALKFADNNGYEKVLILGEEELKNSILKEKNLLTGEEKEIDLSSF